MLIKVDGVLRIVKDIYNNCIIVIQKATMKYKRGRFFIEKKRDLYENHNNIYSKYV